MGYFVKRNKSTSKSYYTGYVRLVDGSRDRPSASYSQERSDALDFKTQAAALYFIERHSLNYGGLTSDYIIEAPARQLLIDFSPV